MEASLHGLRFPATLVLAALVAILVPETPSHAEVPRSAASASPATAASAGSFRAPGGADPVRANAECGACHVAIAAEHAASEHRTAFTDPAFQRALALEPFPFCRSCHATEADPAVPPSAPLAALGVSCAACHGDPRAPLAAHASPSSPHAITVDATFATDAVCARCHQFLFPDGQRRTTPQLFQRTMNEHAASPFAATSCADCHLPKSNGHRSHALASSRDPRAIKAAVKIEARRATSGPAGRVVITLATQGVGHAFPTGDLFRRVVVEAEIVGADHASLGTRSIFLARTFQDVPRGFGVVRTEIADTRLVAGKPREILLDLGALAVENEVSVRVSYQRVAGGGAHAMATVGSEVLLFASVLPPSEGTARSRH